MEGREIEKKKIGRKGGRKERKGNRHTTSQRVSWVEKVSVTGKKLS